MAQLMHVRALKSFSAQSGPPSSWELLSTFLRDRGVQPKREVRNGPGDKWFVYEISFILDQRPFEGKSVQHVKEEDALEDACQRVIAKLNTISNYKVYLDSLPPFSLKTRTNLHTDTPTCQHTSMQPSQPDDAHMYHSMDTVYCPSADPSPSKTVQINTPTNPPTPPTTTDYVKELKKNFIKPIFKSIEKSDGWYTKVMVPGCMMEGDVPKCNERESKQYAAKLVLQKLGSRERK